MGSVDAEFSVTGERKKRDPSGTSLKKTSVIDRSLNGYIRRHRSVVFVRHIIWVIVIGIACTFGRRLEFHRYIFISGGLVAAVLIARAIWLSFRRRDRVAASIEIEKRWPQFDQRLITVASDSSRNTLLEQLRREVETVFNEAPVKTRVSLRPLAVPVLILIASVLILCF